MSVIESMDTMQAWTVGLRLAMGYPQYAPIGNPIAYASGGRKNFAEALEIAAIVEQTNRDLVLVAFDLPIANGPVGISLAVPHQGEYGRHDKRGRERDETPAIRNAATAVHGKSRHQRFIEVQAEPGQAVQEVVEDAQHVVRDRHHRQTFDDALQPELQRRAEHARAIGDAEVLGRGLRQALMHPAQPRFPLGRVRRKELETDRRPHRARPQ